MSDSNLFQPASKDTAEKAAAILIGFYPATKANDHYKQALVRVFESTPDKIVTRAIDPSIGIAANYHRLPTLKQIREWIDCEMEELKAQQTMANADRITARNFNKRAYAYGIAKYGKAKRGQPLVQWPTISPQDAAWQDWSSYFERLRWYPLAFLCVAAGDSRHGVYTVPCLSPKDFDPRAYEWS